MNRKSLDFYVIGAKKSGTTSLYYYFSKIPELCIHDCKELSFLIDGFEESGTFEKVIDAYYKGADQKLIWGAVSPHYIYDNAIPEKLKEFMPNGKLIVIIRDPIERAISNYHMMQSQGYEINDFDDVITTQLDPISLSKQRNRDFYHRADLDSYVVWGEYGRLIESLTEFVEQRNILVIFLEELAAEPANVFTKVCDFIGIKDVQLPDNLGAKYNNAENKNSYLNYLHSNLRNNKLITTIWRAFVPDAYKREITYKYNLGVNQKFKKPALTPDIELLLVNHYLADIRKLELLIGRTVPWSRFNSDA